MIHLPIHNLHTYKISYSLTHASTVNIIYAHVLFVHVNHNTFSIPEPEVSSITT